MPQESNAGEILTSAAKTCLEYALLNVPPTVALEVEVKVNDFEFFQVKALHLKIL